MSPHNTDQMSQWSQVSRIALCMAKVKVTQWVTRSPIELSWTAKKRGQQVYRLLFLVWMCSALSSSNVLDLTIFSDCFFFFKIAKTYQKLSRLTKFPNLSKCQKLSSKIFIKNCQQKLSSKIFIKNFHQKLSSKIVIRNCHHKLSSEIVIRNWSSKIVMKKL